MAIRVYVLDDDELIRITLSSFLEQEGYEVSAFAQPDHCPIYYSKTCGCKKGQACADIIITDLNMPGQSGMDFIENQIRRGCKVNHIAVMSGDWSDPGLNKARHMGLMVFLKPFSILHIRKWLRQVRQELESVEVDIDMAVLDANSEKQKIVKKEKLSLLRSSIKSEK